MYKGLLFISFCFLLASCDIRNQKGKKDVQYAQQQQQIKDSTTVQMIDSVYDFGKVTDGEEVQYSFRFKNTGKNPLIVLTASASCGCTVPEKPEKPVEPGELGVIKVVFHSAGRVGNVHKEVYVRSNARPPFPTLKLLGEVTTKQ
jgi:hypothetical protein